MRSIYILEKTLPRAWEKAVLETWEKGESFKTEYDKPGEPKSKDTTALIHITNPFEEPRIHRAFPGGLDDLEKYRQEVVYGVHDLWVDPDAGKWEYTYHQRLREYEVPGIGNIDQIAKVIEKLKQAPHTRRAQAVTWKAWEDIGISDPACLQRMWFRVSEDNKLNMNIHIRSNDAYKAGFMNMYAFTELQKTVAEELGVEPGEYIHMADSFHIYGSYFNEFQGFLKQAKTRTWDEKTYTTEFAQEIFDEGKMQLLQEKDLPQKHKVRIYNELPSELQEKYNESK
tara:strand:+ start:1018 stop:1869 length:852 start_codon:yes stop_codon:yes gene_type:complete